MRQRAGQQLGRDSLLIIDDTGFPKPGKHSVGVTGQYSGTLGKVGNYLIAVSLQCQFDRSVACIDADLYIAESCASDENRLKRADVPEGVGYHQKCQIALEMIQRAPDRGIRAPVLANAAVEP